MPTSRHSSVTSWKLKANQACSCILAIPESEVFSTHSSESILPTMIPTLPPPATMPHLPPSVPSEPPPILTMPSTSSPPPTVSPCVLKGTNNVLYYFFFNFNIATPNIMLLTILCYIYVGSHTMHALRPRLHINN